MTGKPRNSLRTGVRSLGIVFTTLLVAGCGSQGIQTSQPGGSGDQPAEPQGTLVVALSNAAPNLDRQIVSSNGAWDTLFTVVDPVVEIGANGEILPGLVESWEFPNETTTRLKLREDVVFADGEPLNAEGFKLSMDRILSPESRTGETGLPTISRDGDGVQVVDEFTVDIIHEPDTALLNALAINVEIFSPKQVAEDPESLKTAPIGSGPYEVETFESGRLLRVVARDDYWGAEEYGMPTIREVEFHYGLEPGVRLSQLQAGEAHVIEGLSPDDATLLDDEQIVQLPGPELYWLRYDTIDPDELVADVRVREAIDLAIDKDALTEIFGGYAVVANNLWPDYTPGWADREHEVDVDAARTLIEEAGVVGETVQFSYSPDYKDRMGPVTEAIAAMIEDIGVKVELLSTDGQTYRTQMRDTTNAYDIHLISLSFESFDATRGLESRIGCGGGVSTYCNEDANALLADARAEAGAEARTEIMQQLMDILDEERAVTPLINPPLLWGIDPRLEMDRVPPFNAVPAGRWTLASE